MKALPIIAALLLAGSTLAAGAASLPKDPLNSVMWEDIAERFFPGEIIFDERVKVMMPASAENPFSVPITVDASALNGVQEIVVVADLSPFPHVLSYRPDSAAPFIGFRIKVEQATPVRAGVRTSDGVWHMSGAVVDAAGGGCSAPARAHADANWATTLGQTRASVLREDLDTARITVRMRHPMDTGLADGIPVFYLSRLGITGKDGRTVGTIESREPISENPTFTIKARVAQDEAVLSFAGSDTEGNQYGFSLPVPRPEGLAN